MDVLLSRCHQLSAQGPPPNSPSFTPRCKQMLVDALAAAAAPPVPRGAVASASSEPSIGSSLPSTELPPNDGANVSPAPQAASGEVAICGVADLSPGPNPGRAVALAVVCPVDAQNDFPPSLHLVLDGTGGYAVAALYQADFLSAAAAVSPDNQSSASAAPAGAGLTDGDRDSEKGSASYSSNSSNSSSRSGYSSSPVVAVVVQHPEVVDVRVPRSALLRPPSSSAPISETDAEGTSDERSSSSTVGLQSGVDSNDEAVYAYRCVQVRDGGSVLVHGKPLKCADHESHLKLRLAAFDR